MRRWFFLLLACAALSAQKRPFDANAMMALKRIGDPQISPDGRSVAFSVQTVDVAANKKPTQIWIVPIEGGSPRQITHDGDDNERPRWSPDSKRIAYVSNRTGSSQIWLMDPDGGNAKQVTSFAAEADGVVYSPDGKNLLFTSAVYPECGADNACNQKNLDADAASKVKARTYTELLYRHWTSWQSKRRSHLLVVQTDGGPPRDLTPGTRDVPPFSLGGPDDYDISPDGLEVCYSMNADSVPAISTNADLFVVPIGGPTPDQPARKISISAGADSSPRYSPDGKYIAWRSQSRAGYESDRFRLITIERASGHITNLTENLDRWVNSFTWAPESNAIFFTTADRGRQPIQLIPVGGGEIRTVASGDSELDDMQLTRNGKTLVYTQQTGVSPVEIYSASSSGGAPVALTHLNDATLGTYQTTPLEEFWVDMPDGARVQSFLVKPYGFTPARKYPALMLIHGGPQGNWGHSWTYRWNAQVFAAAGYVVVMPNPRGSTGYGQKFIDDVNHDWGGKPFDDIMAVTDHIVAEIPYADGARMVAAGGSYGGYMIDWILGHTQRFKALISHAGVYDLKSEFGATEELWFPLWEMGGTPWDKPEDYAKWSPDSFVKDFHTPTLVVTGELDFRVPYTQSLELFTALQMQKVPSKLLVYPDEGHWVLKPQNSLLWYKTFLDWVDSWGEKVKVILAAILVLIFVAVIALFAMSGHTTLALTPAVTTIGISTPVSVKALNPHGERSVTAYVEQNGSRYPLFEKSDPSTRLFWQRHAAPRLYMFDAGKTKAPNLKEGKARLVVEAVSNDLRASTDTAAYDVNVVLSAPRVIPDELQHYVNQAGMELVTFTPSGSWNESGVHVGKYTFRSFPLPGHPDERFSMFAYAWDLPPDITPLVYARNSAGTEATAHFWFKLFPKKFRTRDFPIDDALMEKLVNSVDPTGQLVPGPDLVTRFLKINGEMRAKNNQQLADLRFKTEEKILWNGPFIHWGKEEADFADARNYIYHGKQIDHQVHLGFDLSDVTNGPVQAANDGRVVWAADLGIYGNCIVVDHGYSLQSIYGHLKEIDVKVGDMVKKGQKMGIAGQTGLAGGVHVHFSMQIDGVQINPREWWDEHWIHDRIMSKLAPEKSGAETAAVAAPPRAPRKHRR